MDHVRLWLRDSALASLSSEGSPRGTQDRITRILKLPKEFLGWGYTWHSALAGS